MRPTDAVYPEDTEQETVSAAPEITEPVVHMWTPLHLEVDTDYAFVPEGAGFNRASHWLKNFAYWFLPRYNRFMFGLEITGQENLQGITGGAVTICNHVHILDCSMVASAWENRRRPYFPTLKSNFEIPGIRHLVRLLGGVPIPTTAHAMGAFAQAVQDLLEQGEVVHLFPEGILAPYYDGVREFHRGAFTFACESQVPVIPFVISYRPVPPDRPFHKKPYLHLHVMPPVYPRAGVNRREESERLRTLCMEQMRRQYALDMQAQNGML